MNQIIAGHLKERIATLPFIDKLGGLVQTVEVVNRTQTSEIRMRFPVPCELATEDCNNPATYEVLAPDSSKASVIFFEDNGIILDSQDQRYQTWKGQLRLVAWLNTSRYAGSGCDVKALMVQALASRLNGSNNQNVGSIIGLQAKVTAELPKESSIFSNYTFSLYRTQYLFYPYDYFALRIETTFRTVNGCSDQLEIIPPNDCN